MEKKICNRGDYRETLELRNYFFVQIANEIRKPEITIAVVCEQCISVYCSNNNQETKLIETIYCHITLIFFMMYAESDLT